MTDIEDRAEKESDGKASDCVLAEEDCRRRKDRDKEGKRYVAKEGRRSFDILSCYRSLIKLWSGCAVKTMHAQAE